MSDECPDVAAALTYYAVLALFPAFIALAALVGLVGEDRSSVDFLLGVLRDLKAGSVADTLKPTLDELSASTGAGLALFLGLAGALWSASGYTGAFGRAMNRIYEIREGRPFWKLRPLMIVITLAAVILAGLVAIGLVVSGPLARAIGEAIGLGETAVTVWNIAKWPVLLGLAALVVAILYYATPNVKQPKFRWISVGAFTAIVVWVVVSAAFGFYVANFSSYDKTYGALAGVIAFLLWLWLTNLALLFGGELDAELERGRELQRGISAEHDIQLPARDTRNLEKKAEKEAEQVREAREIKQEGG
jgi:membrane protein